MNMNMGSRRYPMIFCPEKKVDHFMVHKSEPPVLVPLSMVLQGSQWFPKHQDSYCMISLTLSVLSNFLVIVKF